MERELFDVHADIEMRHWWFIARRQIVRRVLERFVPPNCGNLVIDVGCGTGGNIASLADGYDTLGLDASEPGIALARERFQGVRFVAGDSPAAVGDALPRASAILLMDVMEHVEDDFSFLRTWAAPLPENAVILITVPADPSLWSPHDETFGHFRRYTRPRLERVWRDTPLRPELVSHFNARLWPVIKAVREVRRVVGGGRKDDFGVGPAAMNGLLQRVFAGEARRVATTGPDSGGYRRGVSLLAVLRRGSGEIAISGKPADLVPDSKLRR